MKKNIVIIVLILISTGFVVYAKIKADEAVKNRMDAMENLVLAQESHQRAEIEREKAMDAAAEAIKQQYEAERLMVELQECQSK